MEEKKELLKRAEIRTMQKDIIRLREEEVLTERERIAGLRTEEEIRKERERIEKLKKEELEREEAKEEAEMRKEIIRKAKEEERKKREEEERERKEKILEERKLEREKAWQIEEEERRKLLERLRAREIPKEEKRVPEKAEEVLVPRPVPKRPSLIEKIFIRVLILLVIFGFFGLLFAFWYWYFKVREIPSPPPPPVEEVIPEIKPEVIIPPSLISVEETETLEISRAEEIPEKFGQVLTKEIKEGDFVRILIKNVPENKLISLSEFFEAFQIKTPDNFYQKLAENYTLFIFSQTAGKRIGFIAEIKEKEGFSDLLKSWEASMEKDFENLFVLLGKEKPALSPYFKDGKHQGVSFRFQTFTLQDLGICYSLFDNYFIFTSSGESITKTIDKLTSPPL